MFLSCFMNIQFGVNKQPKVHGRSLDLNYQRAQFSAVTEGKRPELLNATIRVFSRVTPLYTGTALWPL